MPNLVSRFPQVQVVLEGLIRYAANGLDRSSRAYAGSYYQNCAQLTVVAPAFSELLPLCGIWYVNRSLAQICS